jgi:uncharacterized protein
MTFWKYRDANNYWRWYLEAANGRKIANSGEGYWNEADCDHAIELVKGSYSAPVLKKR